ncbi:tetratricopeptide repeat protein 22-like [Acanthaster planci]|uniref:Tetratricopeptide repeat protein 22-like n=1 Tax=Acanthaster planci TaxID=133434 RepID=A0A8B7XW72_ACAPL|nr:tetratricopeptide repeat protein 22-like [Acanthaster planci]
MNLSEQFRRDSARQTLKLWPSTTHSEVNAGWFSLLRPAQEDVDKSTEAVGLFLLPLTINKDNINAKLADRVIAIRRRFLDFKKTRPERHAIRNLLGVLAFRLGKFDEALEYFDKVLLEGEDPDNLNALANRKYICEKLFLFPEAKECEQRITDLLQNGLENRSKYRKLKARRLAEHAFAYLFELFEESVTFEKYERSSALYKEAIDLAGDLVSQDEMEDWLFASGMASYLIYKRIRRGGLRQHECRDRFQDAVNKFVKVTQMCQDGLILGDSWRTLGELFGKQQNHLPLVPDKFQSYVRHPEQCFKKALSVSQDNPRIIARYADYLQGHSRSKALELLDQSIEKDSTVFNIRAYYIRAKIYMEQFEKDENISSLEKAEEALDVTLEYSFTPWHLELKAKVFYLKAKHQTGIGRQANLQKALLFCAKAVSCQDGQSRPDVHKLRGECLCALGQHKIALGCFKRAIECESAASLYLGSVDLLVCEYEHILLSTPAPLPPDSPLLAGMVYWLHQAAQLCLAARKKLQSLSKIQQLPRHWIRFVMYCHDNKHSQKYETIKLAAAHGSKSGPSGPHRRRMSCHEIDEGFCRPKLPDRSRRNSFPGTDAFFQEPFKWIPSTVTATDLDESQLISHHSKPVDGEIDEDSKDLPFSTKKEYNTLTFTVFWNPKTRKIEIKTLPSLSDTETDDVTSKHVKAAPENSLNRKLTYDFFVIYSEDASEWVLHELLEELEGSGLKGCVKDRDFTLGEYHIENCSKRIKESVCTIIVVTKGFKKGDEFHGMIMALKEGKPVIPVLRGERVLPAPLTGRTCLDATGAVDWARLQRNIEQAIAAVNINGS